MKLEIPKPLTVEHEELHDILVRATKEPGATGEAAREVARLLHPHFVKEEEYALPPLGLLAKLAHGGASEGEMAEVLPMTRRLKEEYSEMLAEHRQIVGALEKLRAAAKQGDQPEYERFADALTLHLSSRLVYSPRRPLFTEHREISDRDFPDSTPLARTGHETLKLSQNAIAGRGTPSPGSSPEWRYPMENRFTLLVQNVVQMIDNREVRTRLRYTEGSEIFLGRPPSLPDGIFRRRSWLPRLGIHRRDLT